MATAAVSMVFTMALVFRGLRAWVKERSKFFGELFSCPYCFSHWVAAVFVVLGKLTGNFSVGFDNQVLDGVVTWLVLVVMSAPFCWVLFKSYSPMKPHEPDDSENEE